MFQKKFLFILLLTFLMSQGVLAQQIKVIPTVYDFGDQAQVFTDKGEIFPPYTVSYEVKHYGERVYTYIYFNGEQVLPHSSRKLLGLTDQKPLTGFWLYKMGAAEIQLEMQEEGCIHSEIVSAVAEYFELYPMMSTVDIDEITLTLVFKSGYSLEYMVSPGVCSYEEGARASVRYYEAMLEKQCSLVFTSAKPLLVYPRHRERLVEEIRLARDMEKNELDSYEWKVLDAKTARALNRNINWKTNDFGR